MSQIAPLDAQSLYRRTQLDAQPVCDSTHRPPFVGQDAALETLALALADPKRGHVVLMAPPGYGRHAIARWALEQAARKRLPPHDLLYVPRFHDSLRPQLLRLPAGKGRELAAAVERLVQRLPELVRGALTADPHRTRIEALMKRHQERQQQALAEIRDGCANDRLKLLQTEEGWALVPTDAHGEPFTPEAYAALPETDRKRWEKRVARWRDRLAAVLARFPEWDEALAPVARHLLHPLREAFADFPEVVAYLEGFEAELVAGLRPWLARNGTEVLIDEAVLAHYLVNPFVVHEAQAHAPVCLGENISHATLVGWVESEVVDDERVSDHRHIRAGLLAQVAEGFLLIDATALLADSDAWQALKRTLAVGSLQIAPPPAHPRWGALPLMTPDPIPFSGQVVLIVTPDIYEALRDLDETFATLFPWVIELERTAPRTRENEARYAAVLRQLLADEGGGGPTVSDEAIARALEAAARAAEDQSRLALTVGRFAGLLREAAAWAERQGRPVVARQEVEAALRARFARTGSAWRETLAAIADGTRLIATGGSRVGQVNGLVVFESGEEAYGHPIRITASVRMGGEGEVLDIERESELGGSLHSKGVMILAAFLSGRFGRRRPLALSATLVMEQSYGFVEGDSASLAEALALLSAIAETPLQQSIAVTGSINQFGEVQAVGAINEKIEGWFAVCDAAGLDGSHGVIFPAANRRHLMLDEAVIAAVRAGRFHLWPVRSVDEAAAALTGCPIRGTQSLPARVADALARFARWHDEKGASWRRPWQRRRDLS
ncbi:AAA family ATPase [Hydrogenophilus thiooxidans]|uniref:AAA family ATPase n=1 Tax=Hydrogenophilus thiooxidans TaxID=2820326 RepID=UPI001C21F34E|nr:AAA family ATPase [Hydrogenophilus thiooxidans]